ERAIEPLLGNALRKPLTIQLGYAKKTDGLRRRLPMACSDELVQPVDQDVFGAEKEHAPPSPQPHLGRILVVREKAPWRLQIDAMLEQHPVTTLPMEA